MLIIGGLIITEYEYDIKPLKENFPKRNRIITAISEGVLVIEAGYRSGTSITARSAKNQGKKVFALPGRLDSPVGIGVNKMIQKGAILTTTVDDILNYYPEFKNRRKHSGNKRICLDCKGEYREIINVLQNKESTFEEILSSTKFSVKDLLKVLTSMEVEGIIDQNLYGRYSLK